MLLQYFTTFDTFKLNSSTTEMVDFTLNLPYFQNSVNNH